MCNTHYAGWRRRGIVLVLVPEPIVTIAQQLAELSTLLRVALGSTGALDPDLIPSLLGVARSSRWDGDCLIGGRDGFYRGISAGRHNRTDAHRAVVLLVHGAMEPEIVSRHSCDRMNCIAPKHLAPGTQSQNVRDAYGRNRMSSNKAHGETSGTAILTADVVCRMREAARGGQSISSIARETPSIGGSAVWAAIRGHSWADLAVLPVAKRPRRTPHRDYSHPRAEALSADILRMWSEGASQGGIALTLGLPKRRVRRIILQAASGLGEFTSHEATS